MLPGPPHSRWLRAAKAPRRVRPAFSEFDMQDHPISSLAILGGAGRAGRPLIEAALQAGYHVRTLLRHPAQVPLTHERLTVLPGDARDTGALRRLLTGCQALISTLGNPRDAAGPIIGDVTQRLLPLLVALGIRRYLTVTSLYDAPHPQDHAPTRQAAEYMQLHFPEFVADRQREYRLLQASALDWTYVRLPRIVEQAPTGQVEASLRHLPGAYVTAADLARFILAELAQPRFRQQAPFVASC